MVPYSLESPTIFYSHATIKTDAQGSCMTVIFWLNLAQSTFDKQKNLQLSSENFLDSISLDPFLR